MNLSPAIQRLEPELIARRRDLHRHPELGFREVRTAGLVAERLESLGYAVQTGIGRTGVVGLWGNADTPAILLRADMDALPLQEENEVEYASENAGVMHACGHDAHTAMLLCVAEALTTEPAPAHCCFKLIFQPAEEGGGGASEMIAAGVLENPTVTQAYATHVWNDLAVGKIGVRPGPVLASADHFEATLTGRGGHGALPHQTKDPVVAAAQLVLNWQTIVSRNVNPLEPAVVTVGSIHAGSVGNIIPDTATLTGTLRAFSTETRHLLIERLKALLAGVATTHELTHELRLTTGYPPTVNDTTAAARVREAAVEVVGEDSVVEQEQVMGAEDFSFFLQKVPGCFFVVGSRNEAKGLTAPHHNARFDIDEQALPLGAEVLLRVAHRAAAQLR